MSNGGHGRGHSRGRTPQRTSQPTGTPAPTAPPPLTSGVAGWPRNIAWSEFPEVGSASGDELAQIKTDVILPSRLSVVHEGGTVRLPTAIEVHLQVTREESWVVRGSQSDALLHHEQGHYDIAGLEARSFVRQLLAIRARDAQDLQTQVTAALTSRRNRSQRLQDKYDARTETDHGRNQAGQTRWDALIRTTVTNGGDLPSPD
jgi:hypothetical protein